jgi:BirA family biotin operon repressor/biotin-[acetyl-CoA-carboxylase] ligase
MQNKILDFLRRHEGYVSGEELSSRLAISRQALWKHIQELKNEGYDIEAVPHLGYKLGSVPDRLYPSEIASGLRTKCIGKKIYYFEEVPSTMDSAMQLGLQVAAEGTLIVAEAQKAGRGRLGRHWLSPKHKGIYFSLILKPALAPSRAPIVTLLAAVSICEAIQQVTGLETKIKWPNDILLKNQKLGGILTELSAEMDAVRFVVIGVGINVNNHRQGLIPTATSLREHAGGTVNRIRLLQEVLRRLELHYLHLGERGNQDILRAWKSFNVTLGRRVKISSQGYTLEGQAVDLDADGALLVRNDAGLTQRVTSGELVHCR